MPSERGPPVFCSQDLEAVGRDLCQQPENPCWRLRTQKRTPQLCSGPSRWRTKPCRRRSGAEGLSPLPARLRCFCGLRGGTHQVGSGQGCAEHVVGTEMWTPLNSHWSACALLDSVTHRPAEVPVSHFLFAAESLSRMLVCLQPLLISLQTLVS